MKIMESPSDSNSLGSTARVIGRVLLTVGLLGLFMGGIFLNTLVNFNVCEQEAEVHGGNIISGFCTHNHFVKLFTKEDGKVDVAHAWRFISFAYIGLLFFVVLTVPQIFGAIDLIASTWGESSNLSYQLVKRHQQIQRLVLFMELATLLAFYLIIVSGPAQHKSSDGVIVLLLASFTGLRLLSYVTVEKYASELEQGIQRANDIQFGMRNKGFEESANFLNIINEKGEK